MYGVKVSKIITLIYFVQLTGRGSPIIKWGPRSISHHRCLSFSFHWLPILVVYSLEANIDTRQRQ